jgi:chemotaxis response regulator CheB
MHGSAHLGLVHFAEAVILQHVLPGPLRAGLEEIVQSELSHLPVRELDDRRRVLAGLGAVQQLVCGKPGC